jgi:hypothetical protein
MSNGSALTAEGMKDQIIQELDKLYGERYHGQSLPGVGREDRDMLFLAISRGILAYLEEKENVLINNITLRNIVGFPYDVEYNVQDMELNIEP